MVAPAVPPVRSGARRMAAASPSHVASAVLSLSFGVEGDRPVVADWDAVLAAATRERCAALAWIRSGAAISEMAPAHVAAAWRTRYREIAARGHAHLAITSRAATALVQSGIAPITLKGAPLATRLYGDPVVRACTDVDWYVRAADRVAARAVLVADGWTHADGAPPWDESLERPGAHGTVHLEIHSSLLHRRFSYLPVPDPESETSRAITEVERVHAGPLVPAYLAAHLATHSLPPLLWLVDLHTAWAMLSRAEQADAQRVASRAGLSRYLAWGLRRADAARRAALGDRRTIRTVGFQIGGRSEPHPMWRHVWLAPSLRVSWSALRGWLAPEWSGSTSSLAATLVRRGPRHWRAAIRPVRETGGRASGPGATPASAPVVHLSGGRLAELVAGVTGVRGEMWMVVTGKSMMPALAPNDRVLLGAPRPRARVGDVVLRAGDDAPVLHRVVRSTTAGVVTRGDACMADDAPVPPASVIARAIAVARGEIITPLSVSPRFGPRPLVGFLVSRVRVRVARHRSSRRDTSAV
ncbi:MAG: nucleotidyltransferase family protein [Gemmatimonadaceae bacterium]